ncbi:MAG: S8/S53 family peptidase [Thioploca sp.]|nr:S8/S53 family peptidase [Thioploca sp.]
MSNEFFGRAKIISPDGKERYDLTVNQQGELVDFNKILNADKQAYYNKYGKISPLLYDKMLQSSEKETLSVSLWVAVKQERIDKSQFTAEELKESYWLLLAYRQQNQTARFNLRNLLREHLGIEVQAESEIAPVVYLNLTPGQIRELNTWREVGGLFLHSTAGFNDLANSMSIANADNVVPPTGIWEGTDTISCVWELGPDDLTNLVIDDHYTTPWPGSSSHARLVTAIIRNVESSAPHGYAPDATIYSGNSYDVAALEWCVKNQYATVVNQSFHRSEEQTSDILSEDDILKDYMALDFPYPTIIQAAGNGDSDEYVNHKGFNSLTVGNHNDSATAMSNTSVFRNPSSLNGDRELPELAANGTDVTAVGLTIEGTSFASPAVAGTVALLQEVDSTLKTWPEANRAILLASATLNVSGSTWYNDIGSIDAHDGSGALNTEEAVEIAGVRQSQNNSASRRGWDVGLLDDSKFDDYEPVFSYSVQVPSSGSTHVKVALAWDSKVGLDPITSEPNSSELVTDFDLYIYDEEYNLVGYSGSYDNSYEIAEFDGIADETYTIKIYRFVGEGESSYYGLAWTVNN